MRLEAVEPPFVVSSAIFMAESLTTELSSPVATPTMPSALFVVAARMPQTFVPCPRASPLVTWEVSDSGVERLAAVVL